MKRSASGKFFSLILGVGILLTPFVIAGTGFLLRGSFLLANERALKSVAEIHLRFQKREPDTTIAWTKTFTERYDLFHYDVWIVDRNGKVLDSNTKQDLPYDWKKLALPSTEGEIRMVPELQNYKYSVSIFKPSFQPQYWIARYDRMNHGLISGILLLPFFGVSLLALASLVAAGIILFYLRKRARTARQVMADLKEGKLNSRFQISQWDEAGELLVAFNEMASHVEHLVHQLRHTERTRNKLLQELSHDLRTPLFSARTMIEALTDSAERLTPEQRQKCAKHAQEEMIYIQQLVEDLFFLAEMDEPSYRTGKDLFDLQTVVEQEIKNRLSQSNSRMWKWECDSSQSYQMLGDRNSIIRLLKNALDNAYRFSRKEIRVRLEVVNQKIHLKIRDDGPGVSPSDCREFGLLRNQNLRSGSIIKRDSLRLGSVIMRTVAEIHQGEVSLRNWKNPSTGKRGGAQITFEFPRAAVALPEAA